MEKKASQDFGLLKEKKKKKEPFFEPGQGSEIRREPKVRRNHSTQGLF